MEYTMIFLPDSQRLMLKFLHNSKENRPDRIASWRHNVEQIV